MEIMQILDEIQKRGITVSVSTLVYPAAHGLVGRVLRVQR
jgi:hypothetical protein